MRVTLAILLTLAMTLPLNAGSEQTETATDVIDQAIANLKPLMKEETTLDESDKKLARSNQTQIETLAMLNSAESKIRLEKGPALNERGKLWDQKRRDLIDSGCPPEGGVMPADIANRCNPLVRALNDEHEQIFREAQALKEQLLTIGATRAAVSETTANNAKQQKTNNARREDLMARKSKLYAQAIAALRNIGAAKAALSKECKDLTDLEAAHCCLSVIWDGVDPRQCNVELLYNVFEKAGFFHTSEVRATTKNP
jgi:DNA repair exonuclease SbcCD ATPase subunit